MKGKRGKRKILLLFFALAIAVLGVGEVKAAPSSITMSGTSRSFNYLDMYFPIKYANDGSSLYCLNFHGNIPRYKTLNLVGANDAGITKIIQNGYPNKGITGDGNQDYYITSMAIHMYIDRRSGVADSQNGNMSAYSKRSVNNSAAAGGMGKHIIDLVNLAASASYDNGTISINTPSTTLFLTDDKNYYITDEITVTGSSSIESSYSLSVSGISNAEVVDMNGNKKVNFNLNEKFKVRIPVDNVNVGTSKLKISVSGKSTVQKTYRYSTGSSSYQDLTPPRTYPETKPVSTNKEFSVNKTMIKVTKTDITGENELDGAHLVVKDSDGNIVDEWDSKKEEPHYIIGLTIGGTYTLEETIAPAGYYLSQTVSFTVLDGEVTTVDMKDEITKVIISKQDITTKKELEGAHLILRDQDGNIIEEWDSTNEPHYIEGLLIGEKYTLEETIAPNGYVLNKEKVEFEIDPSGKPTEVVMYNELQPEVEVPETASNIPFYIYFIGIGSILMGTGVIYKRVKQH